MELEEIDGVEKVEVDLDTKTAKVSIRSPEVEKMILKTLNEIGYPAKM